MIDCLLVYENNYLMNFALSTILSPESGVVAIKSEAKDHQALAEEIHNLGMHVVIIEASAKLADPQSIFSLLVTNPTLRIIVVQSESNFIHIFQKNEVALYQSADLVKAIQSL